MRLAVYSDFAYRRHDGALWTDQAFVVFLGGLAEWVDRLVLVGRHDPTPAPWHFRVTPAAEFAPLPHYAALSDPRAAARAALGSLVAFWRTLRDVDAVWLLGPHPLGLGFALLAIARGRRVVLGVRQDMPAYARSRHPGRRGIRLAALALEGAWRALGRVVPVVAVGPELARNYARARAVLPMSVSLVSERDLERAPADPAPDALVVLSVGRLDAEKNPLLLADVLAELRRDGRPWRLVVCGEGPQRPALEARLRALGVAHAAQLRGYVPVDAGLLDLYRRSHAFLHVSWTEGFPQVLLEAFAARVPVVATAVGAVAEVVGDAARLIPPGDAGAAAAELRRVVDDAAERERLVAAGGVVVRRHTLEAESRRVAEFLAGRA